MRAQVGRGKASRQQAQDQQRAQERLGPHGSQLEPARALVSHPDRAGARAEGVFADRAVVADPLDVQKTSIGLKADLPQRGEAAQPLADLTVARVVDRRIPATLNARPPHLTTSRPIRVRRGGPRMAVKHVRE